jgi:hypothetical protein
MNYLKNKLKGLRNTKLGIFITARISLVLLNLFKINMLDIADQLIAVPPSIREKSGSNIYSNIGCAQRYSLGFLQSHHIIAGRSK